MAGKFPKGKFMSTVRVGEKGQIVIPKPLRDMFDINPGDTILILADEKTGIAIVNNDRMSKILESINIERGELE